MLQQRFEALVKHFNEKKDSLHKTGVTKQLLRVEYVTKYPVSLGKIIFLFGSVSFPLFIEEINGEIIFEILNSDIRPEFAAIRDYLIKVLKKKLIAVDIVIKYTDSQIISATAKSEDIDSINNHMIDSIRFEFVKQEIVRGKGQAMDDKSVNQGRKLGYVSLFQYSIPQRGYYRSKRITWKAKEGRCYYQFRLIKRSIPI